MGKRGDGIYQRAKTWWLDFRHNGQRHQVRLGSHISKSVARELASVKRAAILKGEAGIGRKRKDILFDQAKEQFLEWVKANKRPRTHACFRSCLKNLAEFFGGGKKLGDIHPFLIEKYKTKRLNDNAKVAVNRELSCLRNLFNRCIEWRRYEGPNPVRSVKMVKESKGRVRFLDPGEESALLSFLTEPLGTIALCGIYAGLRVKSEALTLKKQNVDLNLRLLTVQAAHAKTGETRIVPINRLLLEPLKKQMKRANSEWVFVQEDGITPYKSIRTAFETACRRAKLTDVTPHVLRHTFASRLAMAGVDPRTIQELGGWKSLKMVERYSHLSPSHKAEAVEKIAKNFTTLFTTSVESASGVLPQVIEN